MSETTYTRTPIPLRLLFVAHPDLLAPVLQIIHRVIATFLIQQVGLQRTEAHPGAVTLIQRFGPAANLNIHLHCLVLDGVYRTTAGVPVFRVVHAPAAAELQGVLSWIIKRIMTLLTRKGYLVEEQEMTYLQRDGAHYVCRLPDGAAGLKELRDSGAPTLAQDENTSVVWGMPGEAVKLGGVDHILPLQCIGAEMLKLVKQL